MVEIEKPAGDSSQSLLVYTGQPLIDVGVATIVAFNGRDSPAQVTVEDMDRIVEYIADHYTREPLKSFLASIYPNAAYVNPTMGGEKRKTTMMRYLRGYTTVTSEPAGRCAFCGRPASEVVYRQHVPLTAGEGIINFGSGGRPGLQVCGGCLLASQAFPLGCTIKCAGRALLVHSDNPALTLAFAKTFLQENRRLLGLREAADEAKIGFPRTIVVSQLLKIESQRQFEKDFLGSLTAYHLTNYGTNADVTILHLPSQTIDFLRTVQGDQYRQVWQAIVARAWAQPKAVKGKNRELVREDGQATGEQAKGVTSDAVGTRRNRLYEELFGLFEMPANPGKFVRRYLLRGGVEIVVDGSGEADVVKRLSLVSWALTDVFLRKVLFMEKYRIEAIRRVGDRLAAAIEQNNDTNLLKALYGARRYGHLRTELVKADNAQLKAGAAPLISFEDFVVIFEDNEDLPRVDWTLARDLIYIRVLDALYNAEWFTRNRDAAKEVLAQMEQTDAQQDEQAAVSA